MREKELISNIKSILNSSFIGDDCAYLKDLGIVVTQDSLVEDLHFSLEYITPYQLGYKSIVVNLSDIYASGGEPKYLTISLSIPKTIDKDFVSEFYKGVKNACQGDIQVVGGDLTGGDKVYISICAIGKSEGRNISSRSDAKEGYKILLAGEHGSSGAGLKILQNKIRIPDLKSKEKFIKAHLTPQIQKDFAKKISQTVKEPYAMMDTSDGLMDALFTISQMSNTKLVVYFDKILYEKDIEQFENWQNLILFGGEDYGIVALVPNFYDFEGFNTIGYATKGEGVDLNIQQKTIHYSKNEVEDKIFNHFN